MAKDPAVLFYTSDFLTGTAFFTMEQRGQYITLLCEQHQNGHIPKNHMISVCLSYDSPVIKKFSLDEHGLYYNERMEREKVRRANYCASRSNNKSGRKRKKSYDFHTNNHMSLHMETETETETDTVNRTVYSDLFLTFWSAYPRKVGKDRARKAWKKIPRPKETLGLILDALTWQATSEQWTKDNGQFIPHPATYLNDGRWQDERVKTDIDGLREWAMKED